MWWLSLSSNLVWYFHPRGRSHQGISGSCRDFQFHGLLIVYVRFKLKWQCDHLSAHDSVDLSSKVQSTAPCPLKAHRVLNQAQISQKQQSLELHNLSADSEMLSHTQGPNVQGIELNWNRLSIYLGYHQERIVAEPNLNGLYYARGSDWQL